MSVNGIVLQDACVHFGWHINKCQALNTLGILKEKRCGNNGHIISYYSVEHLSVWLFNEQAIVSSTDNFY